MTLQSMTRSGAPFTCANECLSERSAAIDDSVSRNIPHIKTLQIYTKLFHSNCDETIAQITNYLPRFTDLAFFEMTHNRRPLIPKENIGKARIATQAFGDACPTLQACRLHEGAWKKVDGR
ncbi:hypothetical protein B0H19DRAFT_1258154 [Mycena capillaripes]|nr:hypothetical protein B0H19DRAFT_1258154 [Mycena capillaripes]